MNDINLCIFLKYKVVSVIWLTWTSKIKGDIAKVSTKNSNLRSKSPEFLSRCDCLDNIDEVMMSTSYFFNLNEEFGLSNLL